MARTDGSSDVIMMGKDYAGPEGKRLCSELTAGLGRAGALYIGKRRLHASCLGLIRISQVHSLVKIRQQYMSSGCVLYASPYIWYIHLIINKGVCAGCGGIVYISAWASALLVLPDWAMREP